MSPLERETLALAGGLRSRVETRYGVNSSVGRRIPSGVRRACVVAFAIAGRMPPRGRKDRAPRLCQHRSPRCW